jgi:hypothetical protein
MDIHIFDGLPIRVISIKEAITNIYSRPSKQRLELARSRDEVLEDALLLSRQEEAWDVEFEGLPFYAPHIDEQLKQRGYAMTDFTFYTNAPIGGYFTLRKLAPVS